MRIIGALSCRMWGNLLSYVADVDQKLLTETTKANVEKNDVAVLDNEWRWLILCGTAEFLSFISDNFTTKKIPVALKFVSNFFL